MIGFVNRSRTVITAMSLLSVLALGACSDDDPEPKFAPPPSSTAPSSPSTTAVSGPVEPTMPAAARGDDAAAAEAFVKFYWEMADYAQETGDVAGLAALSPKGCKACQQVLDFLESVYRRDGHIRGGETKISDASTAPVGSEGNLLVVRYVLANSHQVVDLPGTKRDEEYEAGTVRIETIVRLTANGWRIEYWDKQT
ncbi:DUF6318 family protein [Nocardioides sp.]|uniref:DUF6318 family protein n=1 Tax=Nocardioides sp. TaxID=35761 RepID=UPI002ED947AA